MKAAVKPRGIIAGMELDFTSPLAEKGKSSVMSRGMQLIKLSTISWC